MLLPLAEGAARTQPMTLGDGLESTLAGMTPLCFAQAYLAEGLLVAFPMLVYPLMAACAVYAVVVIWVLSQMAKRKPEPAMAGD